MTVDDLLDEGVSHQERGELAAARQCYEAALTQDPKHPDALHLLALTFHAEGHYAKAVELIRQALAEDPEASFYHHNLGEALLADNSALEAGSAFARAVELDPTAQHSWRRFIESLILGERVSEAIEASQEALKLFPADDQIFGKIAACFRSQNALEDAAKAYQKAVEIAPENTSHLRNLAISLLAIKDPSAADAARALAHHSAHDSSLLTTAASVLADTKHFQEAYEYARAAVALDANAGQAHFLMGYSLIDLKLPAAAMVSLQKAIDLMPNNEQAYVLLGMAANRLFSEAEALRAFEQALIINPKSIDALTNRGVLLQSRGDNDLAFESFKTVLDLLPDHPQSNLGMGVILHRRGKVTPGELHLRKCIEKSPQNAEAYAALGHNLAEQGRIAEGLVAAKRACELNPALTYAHNNRLFFSLYDYLITADERASIHRQWGETVASRRTTRSKGDRSHHRRLRIGYVSADFRGHAVSFFIEPVLEQHNHAAFEIYCYSDVKEVDLVTDRIKRWADHWVSITGMTDAEVAEKIDRDEIDVLVDLVAHTAGGRLGVFSQRPAQVQVSYIGYPWSTGLPAMQYRISDAFLDPPGADDQLYVEKTVRLDGFWSYRPMDLCPPVADLPAAHGEPFTFGSFNNVSKLNDHVLDVWARILNRVPNSRLMLKYKGLDDPGVAERILTIFSERGVACERIELFGVTSIIEHMAQHNHVDLGLDTFPFNGGTTTFHSFYMGVPVIALEGRGQAERMSSALLRHVGLPEFIARTAEEYVERAVAVANDLGALRVVRASLRARLERSPVMNAVRHTQQLEAAYTQMYEEQCILAAGAATPRMVPLADVQTSAVPSENGKVAFSVIVCGRDGKRRDRSFAHFSTVFKKSGFEFIYVENPYSLAAGYNTAIKECRAPIVIFCHDDIELLNPDADEILSSRLSDADLVGVAGTDHLVAGAWISGGPAHIFGQIAQPLPSGSGFVHYLYGGIHGAMPKIQAVDGLLIAVRRELLKTVQFDEKNFDGFHLYDMDFCYAAHLAGFRLAVAPDLFVIHDSGGNYDLNWEFYRKRFMAKYREVPPDVTRKPHFEQAFAPDRAKLFEMMQHAAILIPSIEQQLRPSVGKY